MILKKNSLPEMSEKLLAIMFNPQITRSFYHYVVLIYSHNYHENKVLSSLRMSIDTTPISTYNDLINKTKKLLIQRKGQKALRIRRNGGTVQWKFQKQYHIFRQTLVPHLGF